MSALAAVFQRDGAPAAAAEVLGMLDVQRRRGPEAQRTWSGGSVALGHGLLATTPEDDLPQPFCTEDGALAVVLDGRLDNRAELASALGQHEPGASDAALVAAAIQRWGEATVAHLLGDFAFVAWDARRRTLVGGRDPLGARPLYFRLAGPTLRCASSPWALAFGNAGPAAPSFAAMALFLAERYVENDRTLFEGVRALGPGAWLSVDATSMRTVAGSWPAPVGRVRHRAASAYAEHFGEVFRDAVRARMRVRGPFAAHVSGGLDSSSVAAVATELRRATFEAPPLLVRCMFPDLTCDESAYSSAVSAHLALPLLDVSMPGELAAYCPDPDLVPRGVYSHPISLMLTRMIDVAAARGARVTLTGAGSDQFLQPTGFELAGALLHGDVGAVARLSGLRAAPFSIAPYRSIVRDGVRRALPERVRRVLRTLRGRGDGLPTWLTAEARRAVHLAEEARAPDSRAYPSLPVRKLATLLAYGTDYSYALVLADQVAAASSADLRHPFYDRRLIDLLLAFPDGERAAAPPVKALLRRAMGGALPDLVRERTEPTEFSPLVQATLVDAHGDRVAAMVRGGRLVEAGLVEPDAVVRLVERARSDPSVLREVVGITALEVWLRQIRA